ncbi:DUF5712 family protein [Capnocytophaga canis]|uniref:DUF5712 family protein n=1 Tax=Capnocytophaga canis TaxID=1848903 RepID=UPI0037CE7154
MYVDPHIESKKGSNTGSCSTYAIYLMKDNAYFFTNDRDNVELEEAITMIDEHSKGQLAKDEAKWYAPVYAFSEKESIHIAYQLFGKKYTDYDELTVKEKEIFTQKILELGRKFQDAMAINFEKEDLGICSGKDLMYIGVVENSRTYKGTDIEVINGLKKVGEAKKGFNTHIHIIQSRKANNAKKSKISPMAKVKSASIELKGNKSKMGFDRNKFYNLVETTFDEEMNYNRSLEEHFEFKKMEKQKQVSQSIDDNPELKKKMEEYTKEVLAILSRIEKKLYPNQIQKEKEKEKKYLHQKEVGYILEKSKIEDYFKKLEQEGKVVFLEQKGDEYLYQEVGKKTVIYVSYEKNKWQNFQEKKGGGVLSAVQKFEQTSWIDSMMIMKKMLDEAKVKRKAEWENIQIINNYNKEQYEKYKKKQQEFKERQEATKVIAEIEVKSDKLLSKLTSFGFYKKTIQQKCKQIKFVTPEGNEYTGVGMKNMSGGWTTINGERESKIGKSDIIFEAGYKNQRKNELLIFEKMSDYLHYLSLNPFAIHHVEDAIILNGRENAQRLKEILRYKNYERVYLVTGADKLHQELSSQCKIEDYRENFTKKTGLLKK